MLIIVTGSPASNVNAKKHAEYFNARVSDGKYHPFDTFRFDRCGKNYQGGYVQGCTSAGRDKATCEAHEDTQIDDD